ncbi:unnamed protein product [Meganyctiphanes norvegica]|uniref:Protein tipE n=1 Tax=Meganyctiphanes norvegica TaxID=48144 RepID=A0AAV2RSZ1_MEGNR
MGSDNKKGCNWRASIRFYITTFFVLLACCSSFAFLFLVPFVINPAFATLFAEFKIDPVTCVTTSYEELKGTSNCSWSSCMEGCTKDLFKCQHIIVNYKNDTEDFFTDKDFIAEDEIETIEWDVVDAKLYPNVKGCGYPPDLNCDDFSQQYGTPGSKYPCYYSKIDPDMVLTHLDLAKTTKELLYAIIIPWACFLVSILYILITYCGMSRPDYNADEPTEISSAKASKDASNYSLRSISKTVNHGISKLMRDSHDDKGHKEHTHTGNCIHHRKKDKIV